MEKQAMENEVTAGTLVNEYNDYVQLKKSQRVYHPPYYTWLKELCGVEVIDITRHMDFDLGNCLKYILRAGRKKEDGLTSIDKQIEDLEKARFYLNDKIEMLKKEADHEVQD